MKRGVECMRRRFERIWRSGKTCFILGGDGVLYVCGWNSSGQLGLGGKANRSTFESVKGIEGTVREMWVSGGTSFLLTDGGQLYACGWSGSGQLGLGDEEDRSTFEPVGGVEGTVREMWLSGSASFLLTDGGQLYACGRNDYGQLGLDNWTDRHSTFEPVKGIEGTVREMWVSDEGSSSFLLSEGGQLYACGGNDYGQLGLGDEANRSTFEPVKVIKRGTVREMWVTDHTSFLLTDSGKLYACGWNGQGQLGLGDKTNRRTFEPVKGIEGEVQEMWVSGGTSFLLTDGGQLYACGRNGYGQLGLGDKVNRRTFESVKGIEGTVREMWLCGSTSFLLTDSGKKYGCGSSLSVSGFKEVEEYPEEEGIFSLDAERVKYFKSDTVTLLSAFYDCLELLAPYIEGSPIFEEGRGAYEKKV